jgi:SAM-dependent methyltransferase
MHHVRDQVAAVREWHRLLKPGGTLVVGDAETDSPTAHFLDDVVGRYNSMGHEGAYLSASFAAALGEAAFHRIRMESRAYTWDFASRAEMLDFCRVLFALDLEPCDGELLGGIEQTIGFVEDGQRCAMQWALLFFRAERAAPGTGET